MVIKYKAKYIRDGEVVIDDTSLIELGSENEPGSNNKVSTADAARPKSNDAWEQMIAQSEERSKDVEPKDNPTTPEK